MREFKKKGSKCWKHLEPVIITHFIELLPT